MRCEVLVGGRLKEAHLVRIDKNTKQAIVQLDEPGHLASVPRQNILWAEEEPALCLGKTTIQRVAEEGQIQVFGYALIAADDLHRKDPYKSFDKLSCAVKQVVQPWNANKTAVARAIDNLAEVYKEVTSEAEEAAVADA